MLTALKRHSSGLFTAAVATTSLLALTGLALAGSALPGSALPGGELLTSYHLQGNNHSSTSSVPDQTVGTNTSISSSDTEPVVGEVVTYTATVAPDDGGTPTGDVAISGNSGTLCTATLDQSNPDEGSCNFSYPAVGSDLVSATYAGDATYIGSTSSQSGETISTAGTTTSIAADPTTSVVGQPVTYTATVAAVSPGSGTPTGEVSFTDSGGTICTGTLDEADTDQASCTTSYPSIGGDSVTANYESDSNYQTSSSAATDETIDQAQTSTDLSASPVDPVVGEPVTYTATVAPTAPGSGAPTGSVEFADSGGTLCTNPLDQSNPDEATCDTTYTTSQDDSITATYEGDTNYVTSESSTYAESVSPAATSTSLSVDHGSPVVGETVTYTATVSVTPPGGGTPTGNVTFEGGGGNTICVSALDEDATDQATCEVSYPSIGGESVTASYGGDPNYDTSTSSENSLTVSQDTTSTSIKSSDTTPVVGETVTYTATVSAQSPGSGTPTGSVTFTGDAGTLCTVSLDQESPDEATCQTSYSGTGSDSVQATYNEDENYSGSQSPNRNETIGVAATAAALTTNTSTPVVGQKVTFKVTITVQSPGSGIPTGKVKLVGDAGKLCTANLDDTSPDLASCSTTYSASGSDSVYAVYEGSSAYEGSGSNSVGESIGAAETSITLASSVSPSLTGQKVTFTVDVSSVSPSSAVPSGSVVFDIKTTSNVQIDCKTSDTVTLSAGSGSCIVAGTKLSAYESPLSVSADFQPNSSFQASSTSLLQDVYAASTKTALVSSNNPTTAGNPANFTATVTAVSPGKGTPTGTVTFSFVPAESLVCTGGDTVNLSGGVATCSIPDGELESSVTVHAMYSGTTPPAYVSSKTSLHEQVNS